MVSKTLNPRLVVGSFCGVPLSGYTDGDFITWAKNEDGMTLKVGADGETAVAVNANESGKVTATFLNTSDTNDYLSTCANTRRRGVLQFTDLGGRTLIFAEDAWLTRPADGGKGKEVGSNAWVFETGNLLIKNAGNNV